MIKEVHFMPLFFDRPHSTFLALRTFSLLMILSLVSGLSFAGSQNSTWRPKKNRPAESIEEDRSPLLPPAPEDKVEAVSSAEKCDDFLRNSSPLPPSLFPSGVDLENLETKNFILIEGTLMGRNTKTYIEPVEHIGWSSEVDLDGMPDIYDPWSVENAHNEIDTVARISGSPLTTGALFSKGGMNTVFSGTYKTDDGLIIPTVNKILTPGLIHKSNRPPKNHTHTMESVVFRERLIHALLRKALFYFMEDIRNKKLNALASGEIFEFRTGIEILKNLVNQSVFVQRGISVQRKIEGGILLGLSEKQFEERGLKKDFDLIMGFIFQVQRDIKKILDDLTKNSDHLTILTTSVFKDSEKNAFTDRISMSDEFNIQEIISKDGTRLSVVEVAIDLITGANAFVKFSENPKDPIQARIYVFDK